MIKRVFISFIMLSCISWIQAQTNEQIESLLIRKQTIGNQPKSINDFFTVEELRVLQKHLNHQNTPSTQDASMSKDFINTAVGSESSGETFGSFNIDESLVYTPISNTSTENEFAGAIDPTNPDTAYVIGQSGDLSSLNISTGVYTNIGSVPAPEDQKWNGAEFDPTTNILYGITSNQTNTSSTLFIIDPIELTATQVGPVGIEVGIVLAIDGDGNAWSYNLIDDNFYAIDLSTGVGTLIGPIGFDANFTQGMTWDPNSNQIFLSAFNNTNVTPELRTVDTETGLTTLIGEIGLEEVSSIAWLGIPLTDELSLEENTFADFSFSPNPSQEFLTISAKTSIQKITIIDLRGKKIREYTNQLNPLIDISGLSKGVYLMEVIINDKRNVYKFIKE